MREVTRYIHTVYYTGRSINERAFTKDDHSELYETP